MAFNLNTSSASELEGGWHIGVVERSPKQAMTGTHKSRRSLMRSNQLVGMR